MAEVFAGYTVLGGSRYQTDRNTAARIVATASGPVLYLYAWVDSNWASLDYKACIYAASVQNNSSSAAAVLAESDVITEVSAAGDGSSAVLLQFAFSVPYVIANGEIVHGGVSQNGTLATGYYYDDNGNANGQFTTHAPDASTPAIDFGDPAEPALNVLNYDASIYLGIDDGGGGGGSDSTPPGLSSAEVNPDGSVNIAFDENTQAGAGGSGGFVINASLGPVTLTPVTALPAEVVTFSGSRLIENHESISNGAFTQPGDGFQDSSSNELASGNFSVTNNSKIHKVCSDAGVSVAYSIAGVVARILGVDLVDGIAPQVVNPDTDGFIQLDDTGLAAGSYWLVTQSDDESLAGIDEWIVN